MFLAIFWAPGKNQKLSPNYLRVHFWGKNFWAPKIIPNLAPEYSGYNFGIFGAQKIFPKMDPGIVWGYFLVNYPGAQKIAKNMLSGYFPVFWPS